MSQFMGYHATQNGARVELDVLQFHSETDCIVVVDVGQNGTDRKTEDVRFQTVLAGGGSTLSMMSVDLSLREQGPFGPAVLDRIGHSTQVSRTPAALRILPASRSAAARIAGEVRA